METDITRYLQTWSAVGDGAPNLEPDVGHIQVLLRLAGRGGKLAIDSKAGLGLTEAITAFQKDIRSSIRVSRRSCSSRTSSVQRRTTATIRCFPKCPARIS